jgi:hypothetical protein
MKMTPELLDAICDELSAGKSLNSICRTLGINVGTVRKFVTKEKARMDRMHAARMEGTDAVMDDIRDFDIIEMDPNRARVALDALKFYVTRMNPEKYGDKIDLNVRGKLDMGAILIAADKRLAALPSRAPIQLPAIDATAQRVDAEGAE